MGGERGEKGRGCGRGLVGVWCDARERVDGWESQLLGDVMQHACQFFNSILHVF